MNRSPYGVLLVSFSRHSHQRSFIPAFSNHPRIRIVAVADEPDIEPALRATNREWADRLGVPCLEDIDAAIARPDVHIVSIGHEIERRAGIAIKAAAAGKHLWIDKFIGRNVRECRRVVEASLRAGIVSIIPSYVYNTLVLNSQKALASGALGRLMGLHVDVMFSKGMPRAISEGEGVGPITSPGRWKYPELKRELLTVGAYAVGLIQVCFDRIIEAHGQGGAYFFPEHANRNMEDFAILTLRDTAGRIATLCAGRVGVATHPAGGPTEGYLFGTGGVAHINGKSPRFDAFIRQRILNADYDPPTHDPMQWASAAPGTAVSLGADPFELALEDFIHALDTGGQPAYTVKEAGDLMEILLAGYHAMVHQAPVLLPLSEEEDEV